MNILDIILLLCLIPAVISGLRKGFIAQVVSIISLVLGVWLSVKFASLVSSWLGQWIETSPQLLNVLSFVIIFVAVVAVLTAIGAIIEKTIKIIMLGWLNRLLGVIFAILKYILILSFAAIAFNALNDRFDLVSKAWLDGSAVYTAVSTVADEVFPYFKELIAK